MRSEIAKKEALLTTEREAITVEREMIGQERQDKITLKFELKE